MYLYFSDFHKTYEPSLESEITNSNVLSPQHPSNIQTKSATTEQDVSSWMQIVIFALFLTILVAIFIVVIIFILKKFVYHKYENTHVINSNSVEHQPQVNGQAANEMVPLMQNNLQQSNVNDNPDGYYEIVDESQNRSNLVENGTSIVMLQPSGSSDHEVMSGMCIVCHHYSFVYVHILRMITYM